MYSNETAQRINAEIAAEANARVVNNITQEHNARVANTREQRIIENHNLEIERFEEHYRKNIATVKSTAGNSMAQTQVAIDMLMELTGKSFEEVRQMIYQNTSKSKRDKIKKWLATYPDFNGGLIHDARVILDKT